MTQASESTLCPVCGAVVTLPGSVCPHCAASEPVTIRVEGANAAEVSKVMRDIMKDAAVRHEAVQLRSPWVSGSFYLTAVILVITLLLVVASVLPAWAVPLIIVGAVLLVAVVGALQLRHDDRLGDQAFVKLMGQTLRLLPVVWSRNSSVPPEE